MSPSHAGDPACGTGDRLDSGSAVPKPPVTYSHQCPYCGEWAAYILVEHVTWWQFGRWLRDKQLLTLACDACGVRWWGRRGRVRATCNKAAFIVSGQQIFHQQL